MSREFGILEHGQMLADPVRMAAYLAAIERVVRQGMVVADIGSGTAIFAMAACRAGARRVYAIEAGAIAAVGRAVVAQNDLASRVEHLEARSFDVTLPERADVIVMDVRGVLPDEQIDVAIDARTRLLAPGGVMIPGTDDLWAAPVEAPELLARHVSAVGDIDDGLMLGAVRASMLERHSRCAIRSDQLLADPVRYATIEYGRIAASTIDAVIEWRASRQGAVHGVVAWFESRLWDGIELSNRPGAPPTLYGQRYFPSPGPLPVLEGQPIRAALSAGVRQNRYESRCILNA